MGDGFLAEFVSPVEAARCALAIRASIEAGEETTDLQFRMGLHLGDVITEKNDIFGDGVIIASRLEQTATPTDILISRAIHDQIATTFTGQLESLGSRPLKNMPAPVEVWRLHRAPDRATKTDSEAAPSIVVLPFSEMGASGDEFLADGIVEEVTAALSGVRDFTVIARQSAFSFKGRQIDVRSVGTQLGARYVVTGSVRQSGSRIRVNVQLADAQTGVQLLSDRFEDQIEDLFDLQDRVAGHVAGAISPAVRASEIATARSLPPEDRGAYALFLSGFPHFWAHHRGENELAIELFTKSLEKNPQETRARCMRAWALAQQACYMWTDDPLESRRAARADAEHALAEVSDHANSLVALAAAISMTTTEFDSARGLLDRALSIDPNSAWGWMRSGWMHCYIEEPDTALRHFERAAELSPRDPFFFNIQFGRGFAYGVLGQFDQAISSFKNGLAAGRGAAWAYRDLASFYARAGRQAEADAAVTSLLEHYPDLTIKRVADSMPPAVSERHSPFFRGLKKAGIPDR